MKLSINFDAFKPLLKDFFSAPSSFLKEACQNSERAGATRIDISYLPSDRVLLIEDDGKGFNDDSWAAFFDICTSGWDSDVKSTQKPFGIGALSLLVPAKEVAVWSHGVCEQYNDSLLTEGDYETQKTLTEDVFEGTMIAISIKDDFNIKKVLSLIPELFRGFPIPVFLDGIEVARPHAIDSDRTFQNTDFGQISTGDIEKTLKSYALYVYLQGYLMSSLSSEDHSKRQKVVVHLESNEFRSRVPDRTELVSGEDECLSRVRSHIIYSIQDYLNTQFAKLSLEEFSLRYWYAAKSYTPEIAKVLLIPVSLFKTPDAVYYTNDNDDLYGFARGIFDGRVVSPEDSEKLEQCFLHSEDELDYFSYDKKNPMSQEQKSWVVHHFLLTSRGGFISESDLPDDHWAHEFIRKEEDVVGWKMKGDSTALECSITIDYNSLPVVLCNRFMFTIHLSDGSHQTATSNSAIYADGILYLPSFADSFEDIVRSIFICNQGSEWGFELDNAYMNGLVAEMEAGVAVLRASTIEIAIQDLIMTNSALFAAIQKRFGTHKITFDLSNEYTENNVTSSPLQAA
jgi:hypothetical protein